jgi:hypothetical protein
MNNKPSFDRTLLIPIGVGIFSLIGLCVLLLGGRIVAVRGGVEDIPTATSFQYALIGTEPVLVTETMEEIATEPPAYPPLELETPTLSSFFSPTPTSGITRTTTPISLVTNPPPSRTPTTASTAPLGAGTFDDLDYRMVYNGTWTTQSAVPGGVYQNTLHVSGTLGNSVFFRFIGQELRVFFQAGPSLGTIRLNLDNGPNYDMNESNANTQVYEWVLPSVPNGTHAVTITHLSGGSVNLDYIIIPEVPGTPTSTPTTNP